MKKNMITFPLLMAVLVCLQCTGYSVSTEIREGSRISKMRKAGLILHLSKGTRFTKEEHLRNITSWVAGYKPSKKQLMIFAPGDYSDRLGYYGIEDDRFLQLSMNKKFLRYKSSGVINLYLRQNEAELKKIIADSNLEGIIIYEVLSVLSPEMQFYDFDTVMVIVDKSLNVVYMDYQSDGYDVDELDPAKVKKQLLDKISSRLVVKLKDLNFIE